MTLNLGIDDAGRGPVIGPMIVCGCLLKKSDEAELKKLGVKDSKELTQKRREFLEKEIKKVAINYEVVVIPAEEIDEGLFRKTNLNEIEANAFAKVVNVLNDGDKSKGKIKVIADCPSINLVKWQDTLKQKIENLSNLEVVCEHKADYNHISVAAGSILAKCERERQMAELRESYDELIGSGYPSDPTTIKFLEKNCLKYKDDGIFRKSWATYVKAVAKKSQRTLG